MATLIKSTGEQIEIDDSTLNMEKLQELVDGYIEIVAVIEKSKVLIVNEDGYPTGLPFNHVASKLMGNISQNVIRGNAVLMDRTIFRTME